MSKDHKSILFVMPQLGVTGGVNAIYQLSINMIKRNSCVDIAVVTPICPDLRSVEFDNRAKKFFTLVKLSISNLLRRHESELWRKEKRIKKIYTWRISSRFISKVIIDLGVDNVIATSWETAEAVEKTSVENIAKYYFVQHLEIWRNWSSLAAWDMAIKAYGEKASSHMSAIDSDDAFGENLRRMVLATYHYDLRLITTSKWLGMSLRQAGVERDISYVSIGNSPVYNCVQAENKRFITKAATTLVMPYRGIEWKGDRDGLRAVKAILRLRKNVRVVLFGKRSDMIPCVPNLLFVDSPTDNEVVNCYCSSDIAVFPSWVEGWGSMPMEAMACGLPVVATEVGAVSEYSVDRVSAIWVKPRSWKSIAKALIELIDDPDLRKNIGNEAKLQISSFTWERSAIEFYNSISGD